MYTLTKPKDVPDGSIGGTRTSHDYLTKDEPILYINDTSRLGSNVSLIGLDGTIVIRTFHVSPSSHGLLPLSPSAGNST